MGPEIEHLFSVDIDCDRCGNSMSISIRAFEYPEGALNDVDTEAFGCSFVEQPDVDVVWEDYEFDFPYDSEEILYCSIDNAENRLQYLLSNPEEAYNLSSREFEKVVEEIFRLEGWETQLTQVTKDGGKDIIATRDIGGLPFMIIIECKKYSSKRPVGVGLVRELRGVQDEGRYGKAVLVTTSTFSKEARDFAGEYNKMIDLVEFKNLIKILENTVGHSIR